MGYKLLLVLDSIGDEGGALKHDLIRAVRLALE